MERFHLSLLVAVLVILTLRASPCASQKKGFQSFNCGGGNFTDQKSQIEWTKDPYANESNELLYGSASKVDSGFDNVTSVMTTLRYFPRESPNRKFCYSFQVSNGNTFLVRASFLYGNYDKLNQPPTFFLIINYDKWTSITTSLAPSPIIEELIFVSKDDNLNICLATDTSTNHTPFISTLELRPLEATMYKLSDFQQFYPTGLSKGYGLRLWQRVNYGAKTKAITRYPNDRYDRMWEGNTTGPTMSMNASNVDDASELPAEVMATAITVKDPQANLSFTYEGLPGMISVPGFRMELHFEEVDERVSPAQAPREFGIEFPNSSAVLVEDAQNLSVKKPIVPSSYGPNSVVLDQYLPLPLRITFFPIPPSPLGPLLNAIELFYWTNQSLSAIGTSQGDVYAILLIQSHFKLSGYGQGDPCLPKGYEWTWITCNDDTPQKVTGINLSSFNLTGDIPPSINNLSSLQTIDLSHNMLNGPIPDISNLRDLNYLDISYNDFCGRSPSFQRPTITYKKIGNIGLCDESKCDCNARSSTTMNVVGKDTSTKKYLLAICIMGALYIVMLIIFIFIYKAKNIGKTEDKATSSMRENKNVLGADDLKGLPYLIKMFTYNEISNATLNFTTILGEGGFGKVYHGLLQTGEAIAVKSLADSSKQGLKEFYNEVAILSRVRHKNLVCLLGCCVENTYMLIYEHIEKGNLKDLLYGDKESTDRPLSWTTRLQIALDASKGLEYLHMGCDPPIIHRDVKTSNILLSDKMQAKLADFGLSRLKEGDNNNSHISTINVVGTPGYLDPAYNATNQLTDKSDVYSFGIVLFELICGRAPIDMFKDPSYIVDWATSSIMQGRVEDIVDPMLENGYMVDSLWKVVDMAIGCVENDRMKRPKMSQVFQALQDALEIEMNKRSLPSSKDTSGSSSTSNEKPSTLHYIKAIQQKLQPR